MDTEKKIGYFSQLKLDASFMGGILITNQFSVPLEFKYTEPIVPTEMQKILFGKALEKYIKSTMIRDHLAKEIGIKPSLYIVGHEDRYHLTPIDGRDTVAVQKVPVPPSAMAGRVARTKDREVIVQLDSSDFVRLTFVTPAEAAQQEIINLLTEFSQNMDVVEPLERVENALRSLCQNDS